MEKSILFNCGVELKHTDKLINSFPIKNEIKTRIVNDPIPQLKAVLKLINQDLTEFTEDLLAKEDLFDIPQAYRPNKSIRTNAMIHKNSKVIIKFDFSKFYDCTKFEYFEKYLYQLYPDTKEIRPLIKRLLIDPNTNGLTQGLPCSGALANLSLIPFFKELKANLDDNIIFTQYSDDLIFSLKNNNKPTYQFNIKTLTHLIIKTLRKVNLNYKINTKKTTKQKNHHRKVTGIRINDDNKCTPSRNTYRFFKLFFHLLQTNDINKLLNDFNIESITSLKGMLSYAKSIDETNKINNLITYYEKRNIKI